MNKRQGKLTSLDSLLPQVAKVMGIESRMKELMIMNYWPEIAKGEVGKNSRPYSITKGRKGLILNIATKSSMVAQELNLVKMILLDKINILSMQIGLQISEIVFSTKFWEDNQVPVDLEANLNTTKGVNQRIDADKLSNVELTDTQKKQIDKALKEVHLNNEDKKRLKERLERELKLDNYKEQLGHPVCKECGVVLNNMLAEYCPVCKFQ